jgi:hypothetical protein
VPAEQRDDRGSPMRDPSRRLSWLMPLLPSLRREAMELGAMFEVGQMSLSVPVVEVRVHLPSPLD